MLLLNYTPYTWCNFQHLCDIGSHNDIREHHLPEEYYLRGCIKNVVNLLNTDNLKVLNNLALYIGKALTRQHENY